MSTNNTPNQASNESKPTDAKSPVDQKNEQAKGSNNNQPNAAKPNENADKKSA